MSIRISARSLIYLLLVVFLTWGSFNFGWFVHLFTHPELHPHPFEDNHFIVGSTTMFVVLLLLCSLAMHNRKLRYVVNNQKKSFSDLVYENACFKAISSNFDDMIHLNNLGGDILYANEVTEKILGYKPKELTGKPAHEFIHPEDREALAEDMNKLAVGKTSSTTREIRLLRKDGTYSPAQVRGFPVKIGEGSYLGAVFKDLSREKESQSLFDINRDFQQSIDAIPDLISIHDNNFRIVKVNRALVEYLGKTPGKIFGRYCYELFHHSSKPHVDCPHKKVLAKEEVFNEDIMVAKREETLKISCTPLYNREGKLKGSIHHATIITTETEEQPNDAGIRKYQELIQDLRNQRFLMMMCASCSKYKDENDEWQQITNFFKKRTTIKISHGICPDCVKEIYPEYLDRIGDL